MKYTVGYLVYRPVATHSYHITVTVRSGCFRQLNSMTGTIGIIVVERQADMIQQLTQMGPFLVG